MVGDLEARVVANGHGKYVPLVEYLATLDHASASVQLTVAEIETLTGPLAKTAYTQTYWSSSTIARVNWQRAGWTAHLDYRTERITFTRRRA